MRTLYTASRWAGLTACAFCLAALAGCTASGTSDQSASAPPAAAAPASGTAQVIINGFTFKPKELTVTVGTTVTWTNEDDIHHTVRSGTPDNAGSPLEGKMETQGSTYSYTFTTAGEFPYFCEYHNSMTGTITVQP